GPGDSSRGPSRFPLGKLGEASEDDLNQTTIGAPPKLRAATKAPATAQGVRRKSEDPTVPALEGRPKPGPEAPETPRPSAGGPPAPRAAPRGGRLGRVRALRPLRPLRPARQGGCHGDPPRLRARAARSHPAARDQAPLRRIRPEARAPRRALRGGAHRRPPRS